MGSFSFNPSAIKKQAEDSKKKQERSGGFDSLKLNEEKNFVLILPPTKENAPLFFETLTHQIWKDGKPVVTVASPKFVGEKDPIMETGFQYQQKFKTSKNETLKNLYKLFMPKNARYVNALQLKMNEDKTFTVVDKKPKVLNLPKLAYDAILDEIESADGEEDMKAIFDLNEGRALYLKTNGEQRTNKRYVTCKFLKNQVNLIDSGDIDPEQIIKQMFNLEKLQPAQDAQALAQALKLLKEQANRIISKYAKAPQEDEEMEEDTVEETSSSNEDFDLD